MNALDNLHQRVSLPKLEAPAPSAQQLDNIYRAALRAPDHAALRPWRFLNISGEARNRLGELYVRAAGTGQPELTEEQRTKFLNMPLRAPLVVVAIARIQEHPKVPRDEQLIAAGCAVQNMLLAAHAQDVGAMWRTGDLAYNETVKEGLGLTADEEIIGFIYMGTPTRGKKVPQLEIADYVSDWS